MTEFLQFVVDNWSQLLSVLISIVTFLVLLFKKKVTINDTALSMVLMKLPELIKQAEDLYKDGTAKKLHVLSAAVNYYREIGGVSSRDIIGVISEKVEDILATPEKKEVI